MVGERAWVPTLVNALEGVGTMLPDGRFTGMCSVACGSWHTAAVSTTGDLYTWGWTRFGALGQHIVPSPAASSSLTPPTIVSSGREALHTMGHDAILASNNDLVPLNKEKEKVMESSQISLDSEISPYPGLAKGLSSLLDPELSDQLVWTGCGARYTLALSQEGRVFVWGKISPIESSGLGGEREAGRGGAQMPPFEVDLRRLANLSMMEGEELHPCKGGGGGRVAMKNAVGLPKDSVNSVHASKGSGDSKWRASTVGCGPWYVVLCLTEGDDSTSRR
ncbi:unnamed protein product [Choristocarpus tenellus]